MLFQIHICGACRLNSPNRLIGDSMKIIGVGRGVNLTVVKLLMLIMVGRVLLFKSWKSKRLIRDCVKSIGLGKGNEYHSF